MINLLMGASLLALAKSIYYFTVPLALSQNDQNYTDIDNCLVSFGVHKDCFI